MDDLLARWSSVLGPGEPARDCWADLVSRWSEPHRRYHTMAHLAAVLSIVDDQAGAAVQLAAWYHDAIYDPTRVDNEERSSELAGATLPPLGVEPGTVAEARRLVLVTTTHEYDAGDTDAALLCDADLSVLAAPPAAYVAYANAIRAEYAHVSDAAFRAGRTRMLDTLLMRERLFSPASAVLEERARSNMRAELALLRSKPGT